MQKVGTTIHKTEGLSVFRSPPPHGNEGFYKLVFGWLGSTPTGGGTHFNDTTRRLSRARQVWSRIRPQLGRLQLRPRRLGELIQSAVFASMLYASETSLSFGARHSPI